MTEAEYRAGMEAFSPKVTRSAPIGPPPANVHWTRQGRDGRDDPIWNSPSGRHQIGRAGALTPAQIHRGRYGERSHRAERAGPI
ncbi:hypothetical protein [Plantactinospora sp. KLBMP9567]|uniref:hypothetical protein n=1 Tax=Plantactinospora sp. KLBMP9567 TaxID=3085900 RepID=UPI0029827C24|nr:hypothetical protein [Plantactinospora sp. KLBMP9567]MDW5326108.1 hypothetical protein [Plantactinospora sp. KLBMP9567]